MNKKETGTSEKIKILIIETKGTTTKLLKKILKGSQYVFNTVKNHSEAVKKLSAEKYEIVITETKFSGEKDIELIKHVKDTKSELCLLVTSGFSSIKDALNSLKAGAYDYIPVPFDEDAVKIILSKAIERQQLYKERDKYKELSCLDGLTSIYNHRHFHELLNTETARSKRYNHTVSILMIDIDNFKYFNDNYGHLEGDRILKKVSNLFLQNVRDVDYVCRYGGDEFVIILPETDKDGAFILARRLRLLTPTLFSKSRKNAYKEKLTISIGLSNYPIDAKDKNELIKKSDLALYESKYLGKNRICIFTPELGQKGNAKNK